MDSEKIGNNIKYYRNKHKMSQDELAYKLNIARQTISNWENGKSEPDADYIAMICELFDVDYADFTGIEASERDGGEALASRLEKKRVISESIGEMSSKDRELLCDALEYVEAMVREQSMRAKVRKLIVTAIGVCFVLCLIGLVVLTAFIFGPSLFSDNPWATCVIIYIDDYDKMALAAIICAIAAAISLAVVVYEIYNIKTWRKKK